MAVMWCPGPEGGVDVEMHRGHRRGRVFTIVRGRIGCEYRRCGFGGRRIPAIGRLYGLFGRVRCARAMLSRQWSRQRSEVRGAAGYSGRYYAANQLLNQLLNQLALIQSPESETSDFTLPFNPSIHDHPLRPPTRSLPPEIRLTAQREHLDSVQPSKGTQPITMSHYIGKVHTPSTQPPPPQSQLTPSSDPPSLLPLLASRQRLK